MESHRPSIRSWLFCASMAAVCLTMPWAGLGLAATLEFTVNDAAGRRLPCRIHVYDKDDQPQRPKELPFWNDHFVCPGKASLELPAGTYRFEIERGPQYERQIGLAELTNGGVQQIQRKLKRIADLAAEGWYSGDLHVHRPIEQMELLMGAEDLRVAPTITWWNENNLWAGRPLPENPLRQFDGNRFCDVMAGEDEREGGALMFFGLRRPMEITGSTREYPSPMKFIEQARKAEGVWIDIEKPFWWDVPLWLADGRIDSIGLANNHMCRSTMFPNEAWGRPRDEKRLPPPLGNGYWTQELYYHMLNSGLRVVPSAGSASGVLPNPVGYNRVYVHLDGEFTYDKWWQGLKAGRSFVTNGPLLICRANGQLPGHVFSAKQGDSIDIELDISLTTLDTVPKIEIVKNGRIVESRSPDQRGRMAVTFDRSGWLMVRAIAENPRTFRFASTAPYYIEIGPIERRISRRSARLFLDWAEERAQRIKQNLKDPAKLAEVLAFHQRAIEFWQQKLAEANAP